MSKRSSNLRFLVWVLGGFFGAMGICSQVITRNTRSVLAIFFSLMGEPVSRVMRAARFLRASAMVRWLILATEGKIMSN